MPPVSEKGANESDPNNPSGEGSPGAADPKEIEGLKAALTAERKGRQSAESRLARLEGTVEGLKARPSSSPAEAAPRIFTRAELRAAVDAGKITEEQMDAQLETQMETKLEKKLRAEFEAATVETQAASQIDAQMAAYIEAHPDLLDADSDLRAKVQEEFNYFTGVLKQNPKAKSTELAAIRSAVGSLAPKGKRKEPEASGEETGGSDGGKSSGGGGGEEGWKKGLPPALKAHYQKQIDKGIYKGPDDKRLLAEVAIARKARE